MTQLFNRRNHETISQAPTVFDPRSLRQLRSIYGTVPTQMQAMRSLLRCQRSEHSRAVPHAGYGFPGNRHRMNSGENEPAGPGFSLGQPVAALRLRAIAERKYQQPATMTWRRRLKLCAAIARQGVALQWLRGEPTDRTGGYASAGSGATGWIGQITTQWRTEAGISARRRDVAQRYYAKLNKGGRHSVFTAKS